MTQRSIRDQAAALGIEISDLDHDRLRAFMALFLKWNARINLSAARTENDLARHVVDSLAVLPNLSTTRTLVDVGSGGGFPGVVLALVRPGNLHVVALEPIHKKHAFLSAVRRELDAANLEPRALRVEEMDGDERFDAAVSRATFPLADWLQIGARLVGAGGLVLGMEGQEATDLPVGAIRLPYASGDRTRAIIAYRPPLR